MNRVVMRWLLVPIALASAMPINGCKPPMDVQPPKDNRIIIWGAEWRLSPDEISAYGSDHPRYLRIHFDPDADLLLDEVSKVNQEPDYMSVAVPGYGASISLTLGRHQLFCARTPTIYFNCATKFIQDGRTFVLAFKNQPDAASVTRLRDKASTFIRERMTPHA